MDPISHPRWPQCEVAWWLALSQLWQIYRHTWEASSDKESIFDNLRVDYLDLNYLYPSILQHFPPADQI